MSASVRSSAEAAPSSSSGPVGVAASQKSAGSAGGSLPILGKIWREKYEVVEQLSDSADSPKWKGRSCDGTHDVVLRAFRPAEPDVRAQVWSKLGGIDSPHLQHPRDAQRIDEWRVEVADLPKGVPLDVWRASRTSLDADTIKAIVTQLAEALGALHAFELVHLALSPDIIFVEEKGNGLNCLIAGLDALTTFDRKESIPAAVDPFYAPPEALGLNVHVPGPGLCAWDWWSLGRIAQELVLGRHVVAHLAGGGERPFTPELRAQAETLLVEADAKGPRAGGVEKMGELDHQLQLLLRGLLTSARDARWTGDNVDRWVRGLPVKEHYTTPRAETHFRWRGRPCTVPEIAATLQTAEHWAENSVQLFEATTPGTLAHFLRWSQSQSVAHEQLTSALELADSIPLKLSSPAAQREAVTIVALLLLSAGKLMWRGRAFEASTVAAMMIELGEADALMILRALTNRSTALQIERIDPASGRLLTELGRTTGDVEGLLKRYGWLASTDVEPAARVFRLAAEPIPTLRAARDTLAQTFAGSDHPAMEKLFKAQNPGRGELVALAWVSHAPEKYKFYTHGEAAHRRAEALRARGVELVNALTWSQFERALLVGRFVFGGWGWFVLAWLIAGAVAIVLWPGKLGLAFALVPVVAAFALRMLLTPRNARSLQASLPDTRWGWRDGPARCRRELKVAGHGTSGAALETELDNVVKELTALGNVQPPVAPVPELPRFKAVRFAGTLSWGLLVVLAAAAGWRVHQHPPSMKELKMTWAPPQLPAPAVAKSGKTGAAAKSDDKDGDIKVSWPFKAGDDTVKISVRQNAEASSEQVAYATKHGRDLVAPYRPDSITTLIVLPVPSGNDVGVMIFDGKRGELVNQQVYLLEYRPIARTFVELAGRKGVFLDQ